MWGKQDICLVPDIHHILFWYNDVLKIILFFMHQLTTMSRCICHWSPDTLFNDSSRAKTLILTSNKNNSPLLNNVHFCPLGIEWPDSVCVCVRACVCVYNIIRKNSSHTRLHRWEQSYETKYRLKLKTNISAKHHCEWFEKHYIRVNFLELRAQTLPSEDLSSAIIF
jgi:hypothetical protein